jgi:alginate O-acetyltransferase complex protein AlgI
MLFNSLEFLLFFTVILFLFFSVPRSWKWIVLLAASYYFYACWKIDYILLLVAITIIIYLTAVLMERSPDPSFRKSILWFGVICTLSILVFFKYFNFLLETVQLLFDWSPLVFSTGPASLVLPIGLSFYTFQAIGYIIDVYRGKRQPEKHFGILALYVSFFPQLLAGPIERSTRLLPQFRQAHPFDWNQFKNGFIIALWGYFQKLVIADRLAIYVNTVYNQPSEFYGSHLLIALLFFPMQLYCDFAGYSNIAIGVALMMGFRLMNNFNRPFASRSISDFFARWHISLTRWMLDYVYSPLARKARSEKQNYVLIMFVMILIWLWHGASWNFLLVGFLWGIFLVISTWRKNRKDQDPIHRSTHRDNALSAAIRIIGFYLMFAFVAGVLFRSVSISDAFLIWNNMFRDVQFTRESIFVKDFFTYDMAIAVFATVAMQVIEWLDDRHKIFSQFSSLPLWLQYSIAYVLIFALLMLGKFMQQPFVYFQF